MIEQPNLKELEKSLYGKFQEDGIWDLFLGLFLIADGLLMEFSTSSYIAIVAGCMVPFVYGMKKKITEPRLGIVKFSKARKEKEKISYLGVIVVLLLVGMLSTLMIFQISPQTGSESFFVAEPRILLALVFALVLTTVAVMYKIKRFIWYGGMIMLLFALGGLAQLHVTYMFIISGVLITSNGVKLLIEFIKKYPKQDSIVESNGA